MTKPQGYAVVSCHAERTLDDNVWQRYSEVLRRRPGGFVISSLMRPPGAGEDEARFVERARQVSTLGPLGHHIHWTSPVHARPTANNGSPAAQVREEGEWLRAHGFEARSFCGGGWYTDQKVADAVAELGYVDCTATPRRPPYVPDGSPWIMLAQPAWIALPSGRRVLEIPTTHSLGELARAIAGPLPQVVHVYFHDYELLDVRRRLALSALLVALARRRRPATLEELAADREVPWAAVRVG